MSATVKASSPARRALHDAIARHADAVAQAERVAAAQERAMHERISLRNRLDEAREAVRSARAEAPRALVDALLADEPSQARSAVDAARDEVAGMERRLRELEDARELLSAEFRRSAAVVDGAEHALDRAVRDAVLADEATDRLRAAFRAAATRTLRLARSLKSAGINLGAFDAHGQRIVITAEPVAIGAPAAFTPDSAWESAIELFKNDPGAQLPGLPEPEPEPEPDDGDVAAEAA